MSPKLVIFTEELCFGGQNIAALLYAKKEHPEKTLFFFCFTYFPFFVLHVFFLFLFDFFRCCCVRQYFLHTKSVILAPKTGACSSEKTIPVMLFVQRRFISNIGNKLPS